MGQCIELRHAEFAAYPEFSEFLRVVAVPSACRAEFDADPIAWLWNGKDKDKSAQKAWLDANAPGWSIDAVRGQYHDLEEMDALYLDYQVSLVFASAAQQDAWHARNEAIEVEAERLYFRIAEQTAAAAEGVEVCVECGGYMTLADNAQTTRIAQFALTCTAPELVCADCGCREFLGLDEATLADACAHAALRVGLPGVGMPLWTAELGAEWDRRQDAAPEIEVQITADMTADAVVARLDAALAQRGRVFGWRPTLVAA